MSSLLVGCASDNRTVDPLVGGPPLNNNPPAAAPPAALGRPTTGNTTAAVPTALPPLTAGNKNSTAAVAAGPAKPLDPTRDLRIDNVTPMVQPVSRQVPYGRDPQGSAGATLQQPVSATGAPGVAAPIPITNRLSTYEQAQMLLQARQIKWQRLEMVGTGGEWKFSCSAPSRQNPASSRTYEARAATYLAAMQAVLDQMERETGY
ncbi:MAG: hypothetical protein JNM56_29685 [Planctomycetia bacterium]|nr:hypothetical protein [Planctomycetia bacterium]